MKVKDDNFEAVIHALREYYRKNYKNGESNASFLLWIESVIEFDREGA